MLKQSLTIINKLGLHARASMKLVNLAGRYQSEILIRHQDREVNAKSVMGVMVLALSKGVEFELSVEGPDEAEAMQAVAELINDRFGEDE